jgi:hypothetical protein
LRLIASIIWAIDANSVNFGRIYSCRFVCSRKNVVEVR